MGEVSSPLNSATGNADPVPHEATVPPIPASTQRGEQGEPTHSSPQRPQSNPLEIQQAFSSQLEIASSPPSQSRHGPYNMSSLANALPPSGYRHEEYHHGSQQRFNPASSPPILPQMPPVAQYTGQSSMVMPSHGYYMPQPQMPQYYAPSQPSSAQASSGMSPRQNISYYPGPMIMNHPQVPYYYPHSNQYSMPTQNPPPPASARQYNPANVASSGRLISTWPNSQRGGTSIPIQQRNSADERPPDSRRSAVRGPPRKPKQNGHAIWLGNLPPQTDLMKLVNHVSKEAPGLESLFLISKSNCAFANFKDEKLCIAAQQKLHESKFQSVRLVSRLRRNTADGSAVVIPPSGPASDLGVPSDPSPQTQRQALSDIERTSTSGISAQLSNALESGSLQKDRFFILKSLTMEDLELSVRTCVWATQSHNEEALNSAFQKCDNVYLVFSTNKSGEYFGYARMASEINQDPEAAIKFTPASQVTNSLDLPKAIPTDATEHTPKGRIIDDSARGTIFWEVERDEEESGSDEESDAFSGRAAEPATEEEEERTWGKPFKVEWLSTTRLPFYRTRGLRNPWNSNREVKIARDGTEIEPSVGRRLIGLFNKIPSHRPPVMQQSVGMLPGFQQMQPYGSEGQ